MIATTALPRREPSGILKCYRASVLIQGEKSKVKHFYVDSMFTKQCGDTVGPARATFIGTVGKIHAGRSPNFTLAR